MNAIYQTALSFVSQNVGAGQQKRIPKISIYCMAIVFTVGLALGTLAYRCGGTLLGIYSSDPEVIAYGLDRMKVICQIYFLCGMMDVAVGILRGMGYSIMPMLVSLAGAVDCESCGSLLSLYGNIHCLSCTCRIRLPGSSH